MKAVRVRRISTVVVVLALLSGALQPALTGFAQSRRQPPTSPQKKNQHSVPMASSFGVKTSAIRLWGGGHITTFCKSK